MNQNISPLFVHVNKPPVLTRHIEFNKFVDMKFGERLKLARGFKWAIAAIPAIIALFILSVLALAVLSAIGVSIKN